MNLSQLFRLAIMTGFFAGFLLMSLTKIETTETCTVEDRRVETLEIDQASYREALTEKQRIIDGLRKKLEKKTVAASAPLRSVSKYAYLKTLADKDVKGLSLKDKYRAGLYVMARNAKNRYPLLSIDTLRLAVAFSKVGYLECKNRVGQSAINKHSDARGVWQWMPKYRKKHGVPENIHDFQLHEQLPYMWAYFCHKMDNQYTTPTGGRLDATKIKYWVDVYALIFAPRFADDALDVGFYKTCGGTCANRKKKCAYHGNRGYDYNNDGYISKRDIRDRAEAKHFN
jgi:hypothetical protein